MNVKLTLQLSPELRTRLAIESATTGKSNSAIVAELIDKHVTTPGTLEEIDAFLTVRSTDRPAKASGRQGKNTSLYLPAKTELRLHVHGMKTGEDRKSTIIRLIGEHITPWATYDPRTSYARPRDNGRRKSDDQARDSEREAA